MIPQHGTLEISRSRLRHNLALLQSRAAKAALCPVIKSDAYGHGSEIVGELLVQLGIQQACAYTLKEATALSMRTSLSILMLAPLVLREADSSIIQIFEFSRFAVNVCDLATARYLSGILSRVPGSFRNPWQIHVQIDTGLSRAGVDPNDAAELLTWIADDRNFRLEGIFTHFSHGDMPGHPTVAQQFQTLRSVAAPFKQRYPNLNIHAQNSGGLWHLGDACLDMVRVGIALYGLQPSTQYPIPGLQPIARLTAPILAIHDRPAGTGVGYGHTFITRRPSRLAIVPVGYADGYPRGLSSNCVAQIRDLDVPIVGRVSMDQIILDITDLPAAIAPGETVTVISDNPEKPNSLDRMADTLGTISYELATHLGQRLQRRIVD